jgi:hypothetical protein
VTFWRRKMDEMARKALVEIFVGMIDSWGLVGCDEEIKCLREFLSLWGEGNPRVRAIVRKTSKRLLEEKNGKVSKVWVFPRPPPERAGVRVPHLRVVGERTNQNSGM